MRVSVPRRTALQALAGASLGLAVPALAGSPLTPAGRARIRKLAFSDQGGRPDGVQVMVSRNHLFVGHMFSNGFTVMNVTDPTKPTPVRSVPAPANTRTHHRRSDARGVRPGHSDHRQDERRAQLL